MKAVDPLNIKLSVGMLAGGYLDKLGLEVACEQNVRRAAVGHDNRFFRDIILAVQCA
jgi:hypothetical protein